MNRARSPTTSRASADGNPLALAESLVNERDYVPLILRHRDSAGVAESAYPVARPSALYGIFTPGAPGSLVGSRTAGDDSDNGRGSSKWRCNGNRWGWRAPRYRMDFSVMPMVATYRCGVRAEQIAEEFPVVSMDSDALDAVRLLATRRLPGLVVTDRPGMPVTILPASQVVRLLVPRTCWTTRRWPGC